MSEETGLAAQEPEWGSPAEATKEGVPLRTIQRWAKSKTIGTRMEGRTLLVRLADVRARAAARSGAASTAPIAPARSRAMTGVRVGTGAGTGADAGVAPGTMAQTDGELSARVFGMFDQGVLPHEVVQREQVPAPVVLELHRQYTALRQAGGAAKTWSDQVTEIAKQIAAANGRTSLIEGVCESLTQDKLGREEFSGELEILRSELAALKELVRTIVAPSRNHFDCPQCRTRGYVAVQVVCTACGAPTQWGFHPAR